MNFGTKVRVREFEATVVYVNDEGDIRLGCGNEEYATVPKYLCEEMFTPEDGSLYKDGDGDVFVYNAGIGKFQMAVSNGRRVNVDEYNGDDLFCLNYESLVPPVVKL